MGIYSVRLDLTGKRFGKLLVVKAVESKIKPLKWECLCDCGKTKIIVGRSLKSGASASCGCLKSAYLKKTLWTGYEEISGSYFGSLKWGAKRRNLDFQIDLKYIWEIFVKQNRKCALSGDDIFFVQAAVDEHKGTASLDRINNDIGYVKGNVQWVHKDLNFMKQDLSENYFIELCKKVYENRCKPTNSQLDLCV